MPSKAPKTPLPLLLLPFLALSAGAQAIVGQSRPETLNDGIVTSDHYVKPSHDGTAATATPAYQNSYPATENGPTTAKLHTRSEGPVSSLPGTGSPGYTATRPAAPVQTAALNPEDPAAPNTDGDIVLNVPTRPHEVSRGALLHVRLRDALSTRSTAEGSVFTAELLSDVGHGGEVLLPAGSLLRGRVAAVHGGRRITGRASMRLQPETISLPDGTLYRLDATLTDLDSMQDVRVTDEGAVVLKGHPKRDLAVLGGVTGSAAVAGALVGAGVGAAVGAAAGAGVATVVWLKRDVQENLPAGTDLIFAMDESLPITPR